MHKAMFVKVSILEKVRFFLLFLVFFNLNSVFAMDADIKEDKTQDLIGKHIQRNKIEVVWNNYLYVSPQDKTDDIIISEGSHGFIDYTCFKDYNQNGNTNTLSDEIQDIKKEFDKYKDQLNLDDSAEVAIESIVDIYNDEYKIYFNPIIVFKNKSCTFDVIKFDKNGGKVNKSYVRHKIICYYDFLDDLQIVNILKKEKSKEFIERVFGFDDCTCLKFYKYKIDNEECKIDEGVGFTVEDIKKLLKAFSSGDLSKRVTIYYEDFSDVLFDFSDVKISLRNFVSTIDIYFHYHSEYFEGLFFNCEVLDSIFNCSLDSTKAKINSFLNKLQVLGIKIKLKKDEGSGASDDYKLELDDYKYRYVLIHKVELEGDYTQYGLNCINMCEQLRIPIRKGYKYSDLESDIQRILDSIKDGDCSSSVQLELQNTDGDKIENLEDEIAENVEYINIKIKEVIPNGVKVLNEENRFYVQFFTNDGKGYLNMEFKYRDNITGKKLREIANKIIKTRLNGKITSCKLFYNGIEIRDGVTINSDFFNNEGIDPVIIVKFDITSSPLYKKLKEFDRIGGSHSSTTQKERSCCNCACCNGKKKS